MDNQRLCTVGGGRTHNITRLQPHCKKFAFTLAEVLITLGIIGVVAAMTIPNLITNYQKQQTVAQLKKAFSVMAQAVRASQDAEEEYGSCLNLKEGVSYSNSERVELTKELVNNCFAPYMKISQICAPTSDACWKSAKTTNGVTNSIAGNSSGKYRQAVSFVLANGDSVYVWQGQKTDEWNAHARFFYDINGKDSGKSIVGKDVFVMELKDDGRFFLFGKGEPRENLLNSSSISQTCTKTGFADAAEMGYFCGALIQNDGWQISKDYPW